MKRGMGMAGDVRSQGVDVKFTPQELEALATLASREDRSLAGTVHWITRKFLRGELVAADEPSTQRAKR